MHDNDNAGSVCRGHTPGCVGCPPCKLIEEAVLRSKESSQKRGFWSCRKRYRIDEIDTRSIVARCDLWTPTTQSLNLGAGILYYINYIKIKFEVT